MSHSTKEDPGFKVRSLKDSAVASLRLLRSVRFTSFQARAYHFVHALYFYYPRYRLIASVGQCLQNLISESAGVKGIIFAIFMH